MYRTFNINAHARSTLQNLNRLCGTCKINPINIAWEFIKNRYDVQRCISQPMFLFRFNENITKLVNFLYSKEKDNDP